MAITTTTLADDSFKTIVKANGLGGETKSLLLDASKLSGERQVLTCQSHIFIMKY